MANILLGFPNYADNYTLSGGSWQPSLPLTLLQDRRLSRRARSTDAALASTKFVITLDKIRTTSIIAIAGHNLSATSQYRITGNATNSFASPAYDSGWKDVWTDTLDPISGGLTWEDDNFWPMKITAQEAAYYPGLLLHKVSPVKAFLYWQIEINDTANTAGYIDIGRLFFGDAWQPETNFSFGWGIGYEDNSLIEEAIGGAEYYDLRPRFRVAKIAMDYISQAESMTQALSVSRVLGITGEILLIIDPDEKQNLMRTSFIARQRALSPIDNPDPIRFTSAFEFKEIIA